MLVLSILSIDHTQRNISLYESSRTFLFRRSGELDAQFFPKRVNLKTHTKTVKEVNQNTLVPWFSTLYIFMVITRTLFTVTECAINSLVILATITYFKEKRFHVGVHRCQCVPLRRRSAGFAFQAQYLRRYLRWLLHCICLGGGSNHVVFLRPTMIQVRVPPASRHKLD